MTAIASLDYLFGLEQQGIKLGLANIGVLCDALDHPERSYPTVIVAGTNGKGSVVAMIERTLRAAGLKTGRFTSPHLIDLKERFAIDGRSIDHDALTQEASILQAAIRDLLVKEQLDAPPTFFEATTAIAFSLFRRSSVQVAILEVGMGGRFDATNIVTPAAAVVTNIDLDHQQHLGQTLRDIAFEKAGVVKPGGLVVTGETKEEPLKVLRGICAERGGRLIEAVTDVEMDATIVDGMTHLTITTPISTHGPLVLSLRGRHQIENVAVAVRLLESLGHTPIGEIDSASIDVGLTQTKWPGRLQIAHIVGHGKLVLDAAHNTAAAAALQRYLAECYPSGVPMVLAAMRDKDVTGIVRALCPSATRVICTSVSTPRSMSATELSSVVATCCPEIPRCVADTAEAAVNIGWQDGEVVCASGSVYLVGELTRRLSTDATLRPVEVRWPG